MHGFSPPWKEFCFSSVLSCKALNSTDMRGRYYHVSQLYLDWKCILHASDIVLWLLVMYFSIIQQQMCFLDSLQDCFTEHLRLFCFNFISFVVIFFKHFNLRDLAKLQLLKNYTAICSFCFPFKLTFAKINLKGLNIPFPLFWFFLSGQRLSPL